MNILFIDDSPQRHRLFKQNSIGASVDIAQNNTEAIRYLTSGKDYDLICLDYDANEDLSDTFEECIFYIASNYQDFTDTKFIIHSLNEFAVPSVVALYKRLGLDIVECPWLWERIVLENGSYTIRERTYKDNL